MAIVIDSSTAASWGLPDENSPAAGRALDAALAERVIVPSIFWHELRNVFLVSERRSRLTSDETGIGLALVANMSPGVEDTASHDQILDIARRHGLSAYDAAYLALAMDTGAILATLDGKLARAGQAEGVEIITDRD